MGAVLLLSVGQEAVKRMASIMVGAWWMAGSVGAGLEDKRACSLVHKT